MQVNEVNMRLFIAALRSGQYQQGTGTLIEIGEDGIKTYCCLGVACETAQINGLILESEIEISGGPFVRFRWDYGSTASYLPPSVAQWLGIHDERYPNSPVNPKLDCYDEGRRDAVALNDSYKFSFAQIADAFEKTYLPKDAQDEH